MTTLNGKQQRLLEACLDKVPADAIIDALERRYKPVVPKPSGDRWFKPHPSYTGEWPDGLKRYPNGYAKFLGPEVATSIGLETKEGLNACCLPHPRKCGFLDNQCGWVEVSEDEL